MSDLKTIGTRVTPALPPTFGINDPQMRAWADAMTSAWATRNGGGGPTDEQFVRRGDIAGLTSDALLQVFGQGGSTSTPSQQAGIRSVQAVINEVLGSKVVEFLRTPIALSAPVQGLQTALDKVRTSVSDINTKIDALESTNGDAGALVATEAEARAAGDTANASLTTILQSAIFQSMQMGPNLVPNPGFVPGGGAWSDASIVPATQPGVPAGAPTDYVIGSQQRDMVCPTYFRVNQGEVLDATIWVALADSSPEHSACGLNFIEISADGTTPLGYPNIAWITSGATSTWQRLVGSYTVPAGVHFIRVDLAISQTNSQTAVYFAQPVVGRRTGVGYVSMASILSEQTTRADKDNALAQALNTVWASIGGSSALIQDGALAAISPAAVAATKWQAVQAAVTDPNTGAVSSVSIKQEIDSYASKVDGSLNATYGLRVNVNGAVSGFSLMTSAGAGSAPGTASSSFAILADRLSLVSPSNVSVLPFTVDGLGNAIFAGFIYAQGGSFAGALNAATGTFTGALSAATGTFAGSLSAATGTFAGSLSAATGTFSGTLSAAALVLAGNNIFLPAYASSGSTTMLSSSAWTSLATTTAVNPGSTGAVSVVVTLQDSPATTIGGGDTSTTDTYPNSYRILRNGADIGVSFQGVAYTLVDVPGGSASYTLQGLGGAGATNQGRTTYRTVTALGVVR